MRQLLLFLGLTLGCGALTACSTPASPERPPATSATPSAAANAPEPPKPAGAQVVFLGDSLTAGLGLASELSFPSLIQKRIEQRGLPFTVVNAGVSGDTSAGGLRRLEWSLQGHPRVLVVALGGNDGLRGLPPEELKKNLAAIIDRARKEGVAVILAGMEAPPNNGPEYTARFRAVYRDLSRTYDVPLVPFLLADVAGIAALNQGDGIHPNAEGAEKVADTVWRVLEPVLATSTESP